MNGAPEDIPPLPKVGYWWSEKKDKKLGVKEFVDICRQSGLELVKIDLDRSLEEQGPFAAIIHKLVDAIVKAEHGDPKSQAVCKAFQEYCDNHPETVIIDPLPNVAKLLDRNRQYKIVEDSEIQKHGGVFMPAFVELTTSNISENMAKMKAANVTFPCVCKPSLAHGSRVAHEMSLVFNEEGLKDISPPCVAQKFINHNAVLFKLFIIEQNYFIIERPSLKNFHASDSKTIFFHSHDISKPNSASALIELDASEPKTPPIWPEKERLDYIVDVLRQSLKLTLFGIDVIIDNITGQYAIVDMNVFPGYDEVENYFQILSNLIVRRISLQADRLPHLLDKKCSPIFPLPQCKKFTFDLSSDSKEQSMAVISNECKCFCCPISGQCHNMLRSIKELQLENAKKLDLSDEVTIVLRNANSMEKVLNATTADVLCSPDSTQEDSGIETSDSCDEKKKGSIFRIVKRQHSRNHQSAVNSEELL